MFVTLRDGSLKIRDSKHLILTITTCHPVVAATGAHVLLVTIKTVLVKLLRLCFYESVCNSLSVGMRMTGFSFIHFIPFHCKPEAQQIACVV